MHFLIFFFSSCSWLSSFLPLINLSEEILLAAKYFFRWGGGGFLFFFSSSYSFLMWFSTHTLTIVLTYLKNKPSSAVTLCYCSCIFQALLAPFLLTIVLTYLNLPLKASPLLFFFIFHSRPPPPSLFFSFRFHFRFRPPLHPPSPQLRKKALVLLRLPWYCSHSSNPKPQTPPFLMFYVASFLLCFRTLITCTCTCNTLAS